MTENILARIFEHNNWANQQIATACLALTDAQLDAEPHSATRGNIRETLIHLARSQQGYLNTLTLPVEARPKIQLTLPEVPAALEKSGQGLISLARGEFGAPLPEQLKKLDGYTVAPWVVMLQVINHATEHREQIKSMLTALGITPPDIDGWDYGSFRGALTPPAAA